eukprot:11994841-Heterocapsa_arctica.AAC.1
MPYQEMLRPFKTSSSFRNKICAQQLVSDKHPSFYICATVVIKYLLTQYSYCPTTSLGAVVVVPNTCDDSS